ncbi:hypothetical protein M426DRAFT_208980 [Hypoxylon sp. CI-4A]|nr:hypothetical protein M426DRAFT_208980 [Hypoxylon sp. CI-4A]
MRLIFNISMAFIATCHIQTWYVGCYSLGEFSIGQWVYNDPIFELWYPLIYSIKLILSYAIRFIPSIITTKIGFRFHINVCSGAISWHRKSPYQVTCR